jgi:hypothetical protein
LVVFWFSFNVVRKFQLQREKLFFLLKPNQFTICFRNLLPVFNFYCNVDLLTTFTKHTLIEIIFKGIEKSSTFQTIMVIQFPKKSSARNAHIRFKIQFLNFYFSPLLYARKRTRNGLLINFRRHFLLSSFHQALIIHTILKKNKKQFLQLSYKSTFLYILFLFLGEEGKKGNYLRGRCA